MFWFKTRVKRKVYFQYEFPPNSINSFFYWNTDVTLLRRKSKHLQNMYYVLKFFFTIFGTELEKLFWLMKD